MLDTSARLLQLLSLLEGRRFWTGAELAERLEVTERTVRRDVDRLRSLGYPVSSSVGVAGGYQLDVGRTLPPLLLDDDEALAIAISLRTAAAGTVRGTEAAALAALTKLERLLPSRLRRKIRTMRDAVVPLPAHQPQIDASVLTTLAGASRDQQLVTFGYLDRQQKRTRRRVEPYGVVHSHGRWYLVAYDLKREAWRTFRVDRMEGRATIAERFLPRELPERDIASVVAESLRTREHLHRARIVIHAPRERVAKKLHPRAGVLTALSKRRCRFEWNGPSLPELAWYIASLGEEFEVQSPPELVTEINELAGRLSRAAERSN